MDAVILDEEIVPLLALAPAFRLSVDALPEIRDARIVAMQVELSDAVERTDHVVSDDPRVVVRVHRPKGIDGPAAVRVLDPRRRLRPRLLRRWTTPSSTASACTFPCVGVSVEYRLAPETAYPGPLDDCYAGLRWTYEHAAELGIDARPHRHRRASARAVAWPPRSRCSPATAARCRSRSSCSSAR